MKALSLIVSLTVFMTSGYFLVTDFNLSGEMNDIIYMSLLLILMLICVVGILINVPLIIIERRKMKTMVYQNIARKAERIGRVERVERLQWNLETS